MIRSFGCLLLLAGLAACVSTPSSNGADAEMLTAWLSGSFNSTAQSAADVVGGPDGFRAQAARNHEHADVRLHAVPVWTDRIDGRWLYLERTRANRPGSPYFQRVVRVHLDGNALVSDTYLLPGDEQRFAGAWLTPKPLEDITPESLILRAGCTLRWTRTTAGSFVGASEPGACSSELRGAAYATSNMTVSSDRITSWDRGFDAQGEQVWGATSGPYVFEREVGDG